MNGVLRLFVPLLAAAAMADSASTIGGWQRRALRVLRPLCARKLICSSIAVKLVQHRDDNSHTHQLLQQNQFHDGMELVWSHEQS
jgi:hypothetical protein